MSLCFESPDELHIIIIIRIHLPFEIWSTRFKRNLKETIAHKKYLFLANIVSTLYPEYVLITLTNTCAHV